MKKLLLSAALLTSLLAPAAYAQSACKGMSQSKCEADSACTWVSSFERKDGKVVNAFCRKAPGKKAGAAKQQGEKALNKAQGQGKQAADKAKGQAKKAGAKAEGKAKQAGAKAEGKAKKAAAKAEQKAKAAQ